MGKIDEGILAEALCASGNGRQAFAAESDARSRAENCCMQCGRPIGTNEVRILPPRYVQERIGYASRGRASGRRFFCLDCYNRMKPSAMAATYRTREIQTAVTC